MSRLSLSKRLSLRKKLGLGADLGSLQPPAGFQFVYEAGVLVTEDGQPVYERI